MTNTDEIHRDRTTHTSHTSPVGQKGSTAKNKTVPGNETEYKCNLHQLHVTHAKEPRMKRMKRNPSKRLEILKK